MITPTSPHRSAIPTAVNAYPAPHAPVPQAGDRIGRAVVGFLWLIWQAVRIPAFAFLVILEPIVRVLLAGGALLLVLTALFYRAFTRVPHFPFWGMLGTGIASMLLLMLYYALLRLLSGR